jgi:hypothetical protein
MPSASESKVDLMEAIRTLKPTVLIGVSGQGGLFTEEVVRAMAKSTERPIIFPLSNPTSCAEAMPEDIVKWTDGKVRRKSERLRLRSRYLFESLCSRLMLVCTLSSTCVYVLLNYVP